LYARPGPFRFTGRATGAPEPVDGLTNRSPDGILARSGVDDHESLRLAGGKVEESIADAAMEVEIERQLEPRSVVRGLATQAGLRRQVEQNRQVRPEAAGRDVLEGPEVRERQTGAVALIGQR
jgi:hypothetical protein